MDGEAAKIPDTALDELYYESLPAAFVFSKLAKMANVGSPTSELPCIQH